MQTNYSLKDYNSFNFDVSTSFFKTVDDIEDIKKILDNQEVNNDNIFILGGGSNVLFRDNYYGLILHPSSKKTEIIEEDDKEVLVEVSSGTDWDEFVEWTVNNSFYGLENLSLIPGQVGGAPIQNIGAYGVEVKDFIESVKGLYLDSGEEFNILAEACMFDYRSSIFKTDLKNKVFISSVIFRLKKEADFNIEYASLKNELQNKDSISQQDIRDAVIKIRKSKLPDPNEIGNAGSFFKNPIVYKAQYDILKEDYPNLKTYEVDDMYKIPAGWLIDKAGWKGFRNGDAGVHDKQALVLVNHGNAQPKDILDLAEQIKKDVFDKFGIELVSEVTMV